MAYKMIYLTAARQDITIISAYKSQFYTNTLRNFSAAFNNTYSKIAKTPFLYPVYEQNTKYRKAVFMDYTLFYRVDELSKTVKIYRVLHGKRNAGKIL